MAFILNVSAIITYTDNSIDTIAATRDEFGLISVNDGSQNVAAMKNLNLTNCFTTFPINGYTFAFDAGSKTIDSVIFSITAINNKDQCLVRYENNTWTTISGSTDTITTIFDNNFEAVNTFFTIAGITVLDGMAIFRFDDAGAIPTDNSTNPVDTSGNAYHGADSINGDVEIVGGKLVFNGAGSIKVPVSGSLVEPIAVSDTGFRLSVIDVQPTSELFSMELFLYANGINVTICRLTYYAQLDRLMALDQYSDMAVFHKGGGFLEQADSFITDFTKKISYSVDYNFSTGLVRMSTIYDDNAQLTFENTGTLFELDDLTDMQIRIDADAVTVEEISVSKL